MRNNCFLTIWLASFLFLATNSYADTYYVKNGGNDNADGLSDATAWASISKVNNYSFNTGDDVFFKCGDTWTIKGTTTLKIDWSGSSNNYATVGSYYMNNGAETRGVSGTRPAFDGASYTVGSYPSWTFIAVAPTNVWKPLIEAASGTKYTRVENFRLVNSAGFGYWGSGDYGIIKNCYISEIYGTGIQYTDASYNRATGNELFHVCRVFTVAGGDGNGTPAGIGLVRTSYTKIDRNYIHDSWGEGIGYFYGSDHNTFEYNKIVDSMRAGIYGTAAHYNKIRYNLIYGTGNPCFSRSTHGGAPYMAPGLWLDDEQQDHVDKYGASEGNEWYGNLVAYTSAGFKIATHVSSAKFKNSKVYNNTFVGNYYQIQAIGLSSDDASNSQIKNNVFWNSDKTILDSGFVSSIPGLACDYNTWSSTPFSSALRGAHDHTGGDIPFNKKSGWQDGKDLTIKDFETTVSIAGIPLSSPYNNGLSANSSFDRLPFNIIMGSQGANWTAGAVLYPSNYIQSPFLKIANSN